MLGLNFLYNMDVIPLFDEDVCINLWYSGLIVPGYYYTDNFVNIFTDSIIDPALLFEYDKVFTVSQHDYFFNTPFFVEDPFIMPTDSIFINLFQDITFPIYFVNNMEYIYYIVPSVFRTLKYYVYRDYVHFHAFKNDWYALDLGFFETPLLGGLLPMDVYMQIVDQFEPALLQPETGMDFFSPTMNPVIEPSTIVFYIQWICVGFVKYLSSLKNTYYLYVFKKSIWTLKYLLGNKFFLVFTWYVFVWISLQFYYYFAEHVEFWIVLFYMRLIEKRLYRFRLIVSFSLTWNDAYRETRKFLDYALFAINSMVSADQWIIRKKKFYKLLSEGDGFIFNSIKLTYELFPDLLWKRQLHLSIMLSATLGRFIYIFICSFFVFSIRFVLGIFIRYVYIHKMLYYCLYLIYYAFFWIKEDFIQQFFYDLWVCFVKIDNFLATYMFQDYHYALLHMLGDYLKPNQYKYFNVETFEDTPPMHGDWFIKFFNYVRPSKTFPLINFRKFNISYLQTFIWIVINFFLIVPVFYLIYFILRLLYKKYNDFIHYISINYVFYQVKLFFLKKTLNVELKIKFVYFFITVLFYYILKWILLVILIFFLLHFFIFYCHKVTSNLIWCTPKYTCWLVGLPFYLTFQFIRFSLYTCLYLIVQIILRSNIKFLLVFLICIFFNFKLLYITDWYYLYLEEILSDILEVHSYICFYAEQLGFMHLWYYSPINRIPGITSSEIVIDAIYLYEHQLDLFLIPHRFMLTLMNYATGEDHWIDYGLRPEGLARLQEKDVYNIREASNFILYGDPARSWWKFWFTPWQPTRILRLKDYCRAIILFYKDYYTYYFFYIDGVHWFYSLPTLGYRIYWYFYTITQMISFIIFDISVYGVCVTWLYLMPSWFGKYLCTFYFLKVAPIWVFFRGFFYHSWSLYYARTVIFFILSIIKYLFLLIFAILKAIVIFVVEFYIMYFECIWKFFSSTFLQSYIRIVGIRTWKFFWCLYIDFVYIIFKRLPDLIEYKWQRFTELNYEVKYMTIGGMKRHRFRIMRYQALIWLHGYLKSYFDLFNSYCRVDYDDLWELYFIQNPHYNVKRLSAWRVKKYFAAYRYGERFAHTATLLESFYDISYLDYTYIRRFSRPITYWASVRYKSQFDTTVAKYYDLVSLFICIFQGCFWYWLFSSYFAKMPKEAGLYHPQYLWTLFRNDLLNTENHWMESYHSLETFDRYLNKFEELDEFAEIDYEEYQRRDDIEKLFRYTEAGKKYAQYNKEGKVAMHLIREIGDLSKVMRVVKWFKKRYQENLINDTIQNRRERRELKLRLSSRINDVNVKKFWILFEMMKENYIKNFNRESLLKFQKSFDFDYFEFVTDEYNSRFYDLFKTDPDKTVLLLARGCRRDPYLLNLLWVQDEDEQFALDPTLQESHIAGYYLTNNIWNFSYDFSKKFKMIFPDWVWFKDHVTPMIFESNKQVLGQTLFASYEEEFIFDGSFVLLICIPYLIIAQSLRMNYATRAWWINHTGRLEIAFLFKLYIVNNFPFFSEYIYAYPFGGWAYEPYNRYISGHPYIDEWGLLYKFEKWARHDVMYRYTLVYARTTHVWFNNWPDIAAFFRLSAEPWAHTISPYTYLSLLYEFFYLIIIIFVSQLLTLLDLIFCFSTSSILSIQFYWYKIIKLFFIILTIWWGFNKKNLIFNDKLNLNMDIIAYVKRYARVNATRWNLYFNKIKNGFNN